MDIQLLKAIGRHSEAMDTNRYIHKDIKDLKKASIEVENNIKEALNLKV